QTNVLQVQVMAQQKSAWKNKEPREAGEPPFYLPDAPGAVWVKGVAANDYGPLFAMLKSKSVPIEMRTFDIAEKKGTRFSEMSSVLQQVLLFYGPWILIFVVFLIFMRQMRNQGAAG